MNFRVVIPARMQSSRLPGKPLLDLGGKPMIVRVCEQAQQSKAESIVVATDSAEVRAAVEAAGFAACMTRPDHASGTERLAEVCDHYGWADETLVVNVQGDEPFVPPALINQTARQLADSGADMATLAHAIHDADTLFNPNVCKVVLKANADALYFSRAPIPFARDAFSGAVFANLSPPPGQRRQSTQKLPKKLPGGYACYRHIGLYAYRRRFLRDYAGLEPSPLEHIEALEQLRVLWHGYRISVALTDILPPAGVDTPEDAERARQHCATLAALRSDTSVTTQ